MDIKQFTTEQKLIPLVSIEANPWNCNKQDPAIYKKLIQSIKENGFTCPILVRELENDRYQIIDGEHRFTACKDLGFSGIKVENIGIIDDLTAKMLTLALNNLKGHDDIIKRAEILKLLSEGQLSLLPWSKEEIESEKRLIDFDWKQFDKEEIPEEKKDFILHFALTESQNVLIKHALSLTGKKDTNALMVLVKDYLELREDLSQYGEKVWESTLD